MKRRFCYLLIDRENKTISKKTVIAKNIELAQKMAESTGVAEFSHHDSDADARKIKNNPECIIDGWAIIDYNPLHLYPGYRLI
jgi:hypothetical protein